VVVLVGALGPWARNSGLTIDGGQDGFIVAITLAAGCALVIFAATRKATLAAIPLLAGLASAGLIGRVLTDPAGPFGGPGRNIRPEWGIWTALGGSVALALASVALLMETSSRFRRTHGSSVQALAAFGDDAVVEAFASRLNRPDGRRTQILAKLGAHLHLKAAARLIEEVTPVRELDYSRHRVDLLVTSPVILRRLGSVEKEPFTVRWIEESINPGDVFYDIGANVGPYSLIAAKVTCNKARIFAFEPSAASFRDLSRNVLLNDCAQSVVPVPLALWSETGLLSFTFSSPLAGASRHRISREVGMEKPLTETIFGVRLDDLVERFGMPVPTLAKIDVDGYELEVLRGAERTLARPELRSIIVELDAGETDRNTAIKTLLAKAGFDSAVRHSREASRRYPRPKKRPDVYWTFTRSAAAPLCGLAPSGLVERLLASCAGVLHRVSGGRRSPSGSRSWCPRPTRSDSTSHPSSRR
jgi:FkbM family methyltransferase